jgi:glycosyltransferase involved in cell wall biosynthesis
MKKLFVCAPLEHQLQKEDFINLKKAFKIVGVNNTSYLMPPTIKYFLVWILASFTFTPLYILKSDVVYIWFADYLAVPVLFWAQLFGKRSILNVGGYEVSAIKEIGYGNQLKWFRGMVSRWCIRQATVTIVPSDSYHNKVKKVEPDSFVKVVPNAIDTEVLCRIPLPEKDHVVITATYNYRRDWYLKGIPVFRLAAELGKLNYQILSNKSHGELIDAMLRSKVYCQLSHTESCGVTVLEAMACGCVPVVSNVDDLPALIGKTGIVVSRNNTYAVVEAMKKALKMDGEPARERARKFSYARKLTALQDIIEALGE